MKRWVLFGHLKDLTAAEDGAAQNLQEDPCRARRRRAGVEIPPPVVRATVLISCLMAPYLLACRNGVLRPDKALAPSSGHYLICS